MLQKVSKPTTANPSSRFNANNIVKTKLLALAGHLGPAKSAIDKNRHVNRLWDHRPKHMHEPVLYVVLRTAEIFITVDTPNQGNRSASQSHGRNQTMKLPNVHPIEAHQHFLSGLGQPSNQSTHRLGRLYPIISYKSADPFYTMFDGDAAVDGQRSTQLGQ